MRQLHLTRALLAAVITGAVCSSVPFFGYIADSLWKRRGLPAAADLRHYLAAEQPFIISAFIWLLVLLSVPMAILWGISSSRRTLSAPWKAALCGGCLGILLSPPWYVAATVLDRMTAWLSVNDYLEKLHILGPFSIITGALYFLLHSFFIRQALAKKAWLETRV